MEGCGVLEKLVPTGKIMNYDIINDIPDYINIIKRRIKLLMKIVYDRKERVSTIVTFWKNQHKLKNLEVLLGLYFLNT